MFETVLLHGNGIQKVFLIDERGDVLLDLVSLVLGSLKSIDMKLVVLVQYVDDLRVAF